MNILIKYATRERPQQFIEAIRNITNTIGDVNYEIVVSCDYSDGTMDDEIIAQAIKINPRVKVYRGNNTSKIQAINADVDKATIEWDVLFNHSDDMFFTVQSWGVKMIDEIRSVFGNSTKFLAHFNDGWVHERLITYSIIGREAYDIDGYIYYPEYKSFSCDAEAMFVAMMRGYYHYFPNIYYYHQHPANTGNGNDRLYIKNGMHGHEDTELYFERRRNLFFVENPVVVPFNPHDRG